MTHDNLKKHSAVTRSSRRKLRVRDESKKLVMLHTTHFGGLCTSRIIFSKGVGERFSRDLYQLHCARLHARTGPKQFLSYELGIWSIDSGLRQVSELWLKVGLS